MPRLWRSVGKVLETNLNQEDCFMPETKERGNA